MKYIFTLCIAGNIKWLKKNKENWRIKKGKDNKKQKNRMHFDANKEQKTKYEKHNLAS